MSDAEVKPTAGPTVIDFGTRGVCEVCGAKAYHHMAKVCNEHREKPAAKGPTSIDVDPEVKIVRPEPASADTEVKPPKAAKAPAKDDPKAKRALELEQSIMAANPQIVQGFAMLCKPLAPENFYTVQDGNLLVTQYGQAVLFTEGEAKILGKAAAELEASNIGMMATAAVGPVLPVVYAIAGAGVLMFHAYKVAQLRSALLAQHAQQVAAEQAATAGVPTPTVFEDGSTISGDGVAPDLRGFGMTSPNGARPADTDFTAA